MASSSTSTTDLATTLDEKHVSKLYHEIHRILTEAVAREPQNIEYLWRYARSYFDLANGWYTVQTQTPNAKPNMTFNTSGGALQPMHYRTTRQEREGASDAYWIRYCTTMLGS
jgi:hypothetical protein